MRCERGTALEAQEVTHIRLIILHTLDPSPTLLAQTPNDVRPTMLHRPCRCRLVRGRSVPLVSEPSELQGLLYERVGTELGCDFS